MFRSNSIAAAAVSAAIGGGLLCAGEVPRPAPPFSVPVPGGQQISLQSFKGKVVLLEFLLTD